MKPREMLITAIIVVVILAVHTSLQTSMPVIDMLQGMAESAIAIAQSLLQLSC
jgi:hypothetical protein